MSRGIPSLRGTSIGALNVSTELRLQDDGKVLELANDKLDFDKVTEVIDIVSSLWNKSFFTASKNSFMFPSFPR